MQWNKKMETVGDTLKKERIKVKKNLSNVALDTRIDIKKLRALEENNFSVFESPVSIKGFIKIYSEYLNLDPEKILAIYRRDFGEKQPKKENNELKSEKRQIPWKYILLFSPLLLLIPIFIYLFGQFSDFQNPPLLEITLPENNITVQEEVLIITGRTEEGTNVEVKNLKIPLKEDYTFSTNIDLEEGKNTLTIRATNIRNPSRETIEVLNIIYEPIQEIEIEEEEEEISEIEMNVKVENAPTWVEIIVDDQLIVSQVLQPGYAEDFVAERNISVNTSILDNVNVEINGIRKILSRAEFTIRCEIVENKLECQ